MIDPARPWRRAAAGLALTFALAGVVGCAGGHDRGDGSEADLTVRILLRDGIFRSPGAECSGTASMSDLHATAPFRLLDDTESRVAAGELSAGRAVSAVDAELDAALDPETVPRRPTFCELTLAVTAPQAPAYRLAMADREPLDLTSVGGDEWVVSLP